MSLSDLSPDALAALHGEQTTAYAALAAQGLKPTSPVASRPRPSWTSRTPC